MNLFEDPNPFKAWESFYVIVGSAAGALTGLQFVVMALVADIRPQGSREEVDAFASPNIVHFCAALLIAAIVAAPWHRISSAGVMLGLIGAAGVVYQVIVMQRARRTGYQPVFEDWLWHVILPFAVYADILIAALVLQGSAGPALFAVGAAVLMLVFIGIHNSWDTVAYLAVEARKKPPPGPPPTPPA